MKKYLKTLIALFAVTFCLGFTGCGSDGDSDPDTLKDQLQGTWVFDTGVVKVMGQTITIERDQLKDLANQLGVDGFYDEVLTFNGDRVNGGGYTIKGNKIHFDDFKDYEDMWITIKVKGDRMSLTYDMDAEGERVVMTVNYKKNGSRAGFAGKIENSASIVSISRLMK